MPITAQQVAMRRSLVDTLRADSDAIRTHLEMFDYLAPDPETGLMWIDTYSINIDEIGIRLHWGSSSHQTACTALNHALRLKVRSLLPQLVREVLEDTAKRAETAVARFMDTAPPDDASTISKVLGAPPPSSAD